MHLYIMNKFKQISCANNIFVYNLHHKQKTYVFDGAQIL